MSGILAFSVLSALVFLTSRTVQSTAPGDAVTTYSIASDGTVEKNGTTIETWLKSGLASSYQVMATLQSGTLSSGTTGTWLACSSTNSWAVESFGGGLESAVILVQIRKGTTVLTSATITINATST